MWGRANSGALKGQRRWAPRGIAALAIAALASAASAQPGGGALRVGTSGDYAPFSMRSSSAPDGIDGLDLAVARAYASDRGLELEVARFRWPSLLAELEAGRFDVAMSGVTVRPERSLAGRFTLPVATSGAVVLVNDLSRWQELDRLDAGGVRIAVNLGGHLEQVARRRFPLATLVAVRANAEVIDALLKGHVDAAVSDTLEAPIWRARQPDLGQLGPFTRDVKAYLVRPGRDDLARDLDRWLGEREADGTLAALRARYFGDGEWPAAAAPLPALAAAVAERLELMPLVARAKSREGVPLDVPEQEKRVAAALEAGVGRAAGELGLRSPDPKLVSALVRAEIEAAKEVQRRELATGGFEQEAPPSLDGALRPALARVHERAASQIARLAAERSPGRMAVEETVAAELADLELEPARESAIAGAILALAGSTRSAAGDQTGAEAGEHR